MFGFGKVALDLLVRVGGGALHIHLSCNSSSYVLLSKVWSCSGDKRSIARVFELIWCEREVYCRGIEVLHSKSGVISI